MAEARIEKTIFLKADPSRVWAFLTDPEMLARWFHPADRSLAQKSPYQFWRNAESVGEEFCWGEVVDVEADVRLVYTFAHKWLGRHETRVSWRLSPVDGGTRLQLVHEGFQDAPVDVFDCLCDHDAGWDEHFTKLRERVLEPQAEVVA